MYDLCLSFPIQKNCDGRWVTHCIRFLNNLFNEIGETNLNP